jgi:hypothetical protein
MTRTPRILLLAALTFALMIGGPVPAWAGFSASSALPTTTISSGTVAAPATLTIDDYCRTTTTTVRRTVRTDPVTGVQTQTAYSSTSSTTTSTSNVQSSSATSTAGPGVDETTTTTVTVNTDLVVSVTWPASTTVRGVSGYLVNAHLVDGSSFTMAQTDAVSRIAGGTVDADYLYYQPRLSVTTLTTYNWTATTPVSRVLSC